MILEMTGRIGISVGQAIRPVVVGGCRPRACTRTSRLSTLQHRYLSSPVRMDAAAEDMFEATEPVKKKKGRREWLIPETSMSAPSVPVHVLPVHNMQATCVQSDHVNRDFQFVGNEINLAACSLHK